MAKRFTAKRLFCLMAAAGLIGFNQTVLAAAFQLWEQDGASIGNYHAGIAAAAEDASTAFYNPAGLIRMKNQQFVIGADPVLTNFRFSGTVADTGLGNIPQAARAQGGGFNLVPFGHYAAPINDRIVFGLSAVAPFGLKTNYGYDTPLRYAATLTEVQVIDVSPSLGIALTDKFSFGFGLDINRITGSFNQVATAISSVNDTNSTNRGYGTAYGYHLGALYQPTTQTRVGVAYHSQLRLHLKGASNFTGPLANGGEGGQQSSRYLKATATLPSTASASVFHTFDEKWDVMGSLSWTRWSVFRNLVLTNVAAINGTTFDAENIQVYVPENYHNTINYSIGANYHPSEKWIVRTGLGYDPTPSSDRYRNVQLPDSDRIAVALGAHFQASKTIGLDVGWTHMFAMNTRINNSQPLGSTVVSTVGSVDASADVYGFQLTWDIV